MRDDYIERSVAATVVKQVSEAKVPSLKEAAKVAGYSSVHVGKVAGTNRFQRVLWDVAPYELLAGIQKRQAHARYVKKISWGKGADPKTVAKTCLEHEDWRLLRLWTEGKDIKTVYTLLEFPDYDTIDRALDKFYKLGGFYQAEKVEHTIARPLEEMSEAELDKMIAPHVESSPVKSPQDVPNVITGLTEAKTIEGEVVN